MPSAPVFAEHGLVALAQRIRERVHVVARASDGLRGLALADEYAADPAVAVLGTLPPMYPEWLGDRSFAEAHGVRFPYVAGEMANGIATAKMVIALAQADMLGFLGAAGMGLSALAAALDELQAALGERPNWGVNLIHTPTEAAAEDEVAELLLQRGVRRISASAFMGLTPAVVRCAASGLRLDPSGRIVRRTAVFAKVSRPDIAEAFMSPAPDELLALLVRRGQLGEAEAALARRVAVAEDITVEADSAGHTDGRPLAALLPAVLAARDAVVRRHELARPIRVGAAGGLGEPSAVAAAFALGAAYVLTGSVNQMAVEAGTSPQVKAMLARADVTDVTMAPAPDMFELGAQVQVLRRGTLFPAKAARLHQAYRVHPSIAAIPADERRALEREVLGADMDEEWERTRAHWSRCRPAELERAKADPKHRMALLFRSYMSRTSKWAIAGDPEHVADYQIWCSPAAGAFNRWTAGSFLATPECRTVVQIALNLLEGAAVATRAHQLRCYGVALPAAAYNFRPRPLA